MSRVTIVGLGGSLALQSSSLSALRVALDGARDYGAEVRLFDLRELNLPMFVPGAEPVELARAAQLFEAGTITTPEASTVEQQVEPLR